MRLGIFGGTFDPVHYGHLVLAEQCREICELDAVRFLPSGSPPHKQDATITPAKSRIEMLELAIAGHPSFSVDAMELEREGPTYTVDTLQSLYERAESPGQELFFLIGGDSLAEFVIWREPKRIVELATIVAVNRGGQPLPNTALVVEQLGKSLAERIQIVEIPGIDISSTDLRERIRNGRSIRYMTPRPVELYIEQEGLYRTAE